MPLVDATLPPLFTGHPVKAPVRPMAHAVAGARAGNLGAGDLVWARDTARLDCALVLEPEVDAARTMEMLFVAQVAFADAFGAIAPPQTALTLTWPDVVRVNGGRCGRAQITIAEDGSADGTPAWAVLGLDIVLREPDRAVEPGHDPDRTTLHAEGCGEIDRTMLLDAFARHLLSWIHTWEEEGFREVHEQYLPRATGYRETVTIEAAGRSLTGRFVGLDDHGDLLLERDGRVEVVRARDVLAAARQEVEA